MANKSKSEKCRIRVTHIPVIYTSHDELKRIGNPGLPNASKHMRNWRYPTYVTPRRHKLSLRRSHEELRSGYVFEHLEIGHLVGGGKIEGRVIKNHHSRFRFSHGVTVKIFVLAGILPHFLELLKILADGF